MMNKAKIAGKNVEDILGLTSMQEGMLFHYLRSPASKQYLEQIRLKLSGEMDIEVFKQAWDVVCRSNEMLRTVIKWQKLEEPVQVVMKERNVPIGIVDFSNREKKDQAALLDKLYADDKNKAVDLTAEPLRITLCILGEDESEMLITFHHILFDGWSNGIILKEFIEAYRRLSGGEPGRIVEKTKYKEFFKWYRSQDRVEQGEFWKRHLEGFDTRTSLPYDKSKREEICRVRTHKQEITRSLNEQVDNCLQHCGVTLAALMFTTWGLLLQRYNNSGDIVFGTTVSGRTPAVKGIENIVGLFINTLPLRMRTSGEDTVSDLFQSIGHHLRERNERGYEHSSLTEIRKFAAVGTEGNLFDSIVVMDNYPLEGITAGPGLFIRSYDLFEMTNFDLTVQILPSGPDTLEICFHYNEELFEFATVKRMAGHFFNILGEVTGGSGKRVREIVMLSDNEKLQILYKFNDPEIRYMGDKTIHGIIADQAARTPRKRAVQFMDNGLTYEELNGRADGLAAVLGEYGVSGGSRVVMMFPRSIDMIVALLGILKAGAASIPLDITYPPERNDFITADSGAGFLLKHGEVECEPPPGVVEIFYDPGKTGTGKTGSTRDTVKPGDLSYIIYTSGSTGKPKGALLNHWGIVNHTYTKIEVLGITREDSVGNNFSINVIASIWQILAPLFTGGRLVIYSEEIEWDPYAQFQQVARDGVTVIEVIPPVLKAFLFLLDEGKEKVNLEGLRKIALTSEETKPFLVNRFYETYRETQLVDCYGQTECSDDVLHYSIPKNTRTEKVPIGTPSLNTRVLILSLFDQLQPVGVVGEICVSGAGVCGGYWNRPDLNRQKFVPNPFAPEVMMYRTGDLGKWLPDGKVEYLGRIDHQVKIRGNRVELREIENHVLGFTGIKEAAVVAKEDREGEKTLYAFFVPADKREITASGIRQYLLKTLPDYMVPAFFISLEKLPVTPNGKLDRKALVSLEVKASIDSGARYQPPRNDFEKKIRDMWRSLLDKEKIGIDDNFFDLGGHSLLLIKLKSKLEKAFNREVSIIQLFNYPTIAHQAGYFSGSTPVSVDEKVEGDKKMGPSVDRNIAVIGMSIHVPGAENVEEFWDNVITGTESIAFFAGDELEDCEVNEFVGGRLKLIPAGGVLGDIDLFDADFFGFNPREAEIIDPQQRLFLEHAWRALENAGYVGDTYPGRIGVYAGTGLNTYLLNNVMANPEVVGSLGEFQTMIGNDKDFLATRVSYKLNLKGPAITVQTACSTSLVAVHLAKQALVGGECDMALVGGIAVHVPEKSGYFYNEGGYLSPDGHCRAFDAGAQGTVFGNGIGIVILKRLAEAAVENDHIYAVIKGSAINNDGSLKVGYTSPSEIGQAAVISAALQESGIPPETVGYIETHGTGTVLGDPVEIAALTRAFAGSKKQYCAVGSLKSNIGHLDIAAGVVGLIKAVLCLVHKKIPISINVVNPNPMIDFPNTPFYVNRESRDWTGDSCPRRAGVSSFGIGGTNAHVVLEEAPEDSGSESRGEPLCSPEDSRQYKLILLSARTESAREQMTGNLVRYFKNNPGINLADAAYTLQVGRKRFDCSLALVCRDREDALAALEPPDPKRVLLHTRQPGDKSVVFMFPGVGEHYVNMTAGLYRKEPVFRRHVDRCCDILKPILGTDLRRILYVDSVEKEGKNSGSGETVNFRKLVDRRDEPLTEEEKQLSRTIYSQTSVFVVEYALASLLMEWGIKPYAMIGYSIGEYTAACLAGVFSLEDALFLVAGRAKLIHGVEEGAMLAVSLPEDRLKPLLTGGLFLAAVNTPDLCIVSGKLPAIDRLEKRLQEQKEVFRRLKTFQAFHSPMMTSVRPQLTALFREVPRSPAAVPYISNVTGTWVTAEQVIDPGYWVTHTESPIRFSAGISTLLKTSCNFFLEIGPGNSLSGFTAQHRHIKSDTAVERFVLASLPKESEQVPDDAFLLRALGKLWAAGLDIRWESVYRHEPRKRVPLPTYPFERKRYWLQPFQPGSREIKAAPGRDIIEKKKKIDDWFYIPTWKQTVPPFDLQNGKGEGETGEKCWLFFLDETGIGLQLVRQLTMENNNHDITLVKAGQSFSTEYRDNRRVYTINPGNFTDYRALLEEFQAAGKSIDKMIHLWLLTSPGEYRSDWLDRGVFSLLYLAKAMGKQSMFNSMELWVVSRGVHKIERGDRGSPEGAAILGPCKVIGQEYPNILCRSIDIGGGADEEVEIKNLMAEFKLSSSHPVIVYRGPLRWVQSFEPVKLAEAPDIPVILREKGVYLVTGGLGRIGLTIARYLAQSVHARLVLTGRSKLPVEEEKNPKVMQIRQLEDMGARVLVVQADAADRGQMQQAVKEADETFGTIHGVIHAAGVMDEKAFKLIADCDREDCQLHFKPKIHGLMVLEEVLRDKELDFCLLTSSLSPILGGLSLYAYSAANSFMDAFARQQNLVQGKNWISINWADWEPNGGEPVSDSCANLVLGSTVVQLNITPEEGKETLKRVLSLSRNGSKIPGIVISSGDLHRRLRQWVLGDSEPGTGQDGETGTGKRSQEVHQRPQLQSIFEAPGSQAEEIVAEIWQELLGIRSVGVHDNFFELGGHSLIATKLISRLREIFQIDIPLPTLFDHPTIREVVDNIVVTWGDNETVEEIAKTYREVQSM